MTKIYFASDFHLNFFGDQDYTQREDKIYNWLKSLEGKADILYILGDLFDYWFEYREVIPKGNVRILFQLKELVSRKTRVILYTGNHDQWHRDYLHNYIGIEMRLEPSVVEHDGKRFYLGHGDGVGKGEWQYKTMKFVLKNRLCRFLFSLLHPDWGVRLMRKLSAKSRSSQVNKEDLDKAIFRHMSFAEGLLKEGRQIDYFIMGHLHTVVERPLSNGKSVYVNLGLWKSTESYAIWDGRALVLIK